MPTTRPDPVTPQRSTTRLMQGVAADRARTRRISMSTPLLGNMLQSQLGARIHVKRIQTAALLILNGLRPMPRLRSHRLSMQNPVSHSALAQRMTFFYGNLLQSQLGSRIQVGYIPAPMPYTVPMARLGSHRLRMQEANISLSQCIMGINSHPLAHLQKDWNLPSRGGQS